MNEFTLILSVLVALVVGFIIGRFTSRAGDAAKLQSAYNKSRKELEQVKRDLGDHFTGSAALLEQLDEQYQRLYQYMAEQNQKLCGENGSFKHEQIDTTGAVDEYGTDVQPLDYSGEPSGLLRDQQKTG
ncbi:YhcB family protein [Pseudaeromonas paramecii]|uniref:Z-ring associated protein G n=1 Tax=Pseudaeromonas paramecii TaxID=2138166 RepID=A0ABP8Q8K3_9GAMM